MATASDAFERTNGSMGTNWTSFSGGPFTITDGSVAGPIGSTGDAGWTGSTFGADQFSEIKIRTTFFLGNPAAQWHGAAVRLGTNKAYVAIFYNGNIGLYAWDGSLFNIITSVAQSPNSGDRLRIVATGNPVTLTVYYNDTLVITSTDTTGHNFVTGLTGMMMFAYFFLSIESWCGGDGTGGSGVAAALHPAPLAPFKLGVGSKMWVANKRISAGAVTLDWGGSPYSLSVQDSVTRPLRYVVPTSPELSRPHRFLYVLPVEEDDGSPEGTFGDGINYLITHNIHNLYNCTLVGLNTNGLFWGADHATDLTLRQESYLINDFRPWVIANLSQTGIEEHWLIGFSRTGLRAIFTMMKHPTLFQYAAAWDAAVDTDWATGVSTFHFDWEFGTQANYEDNYQLSQPNLHTWAVPFVAKKRIWISGDPVVFQAAVSALKARFDIEGIQYDYSNEGAIFPAATHHWSSSADWELRAMASLDLMAQVPFFHGLLDEISMYGTALSPSRILDHSRLGGSWFDIAPDLLASGNLSIKYGIDGNRPIDVFASVGECKFVLRNDAGNRGGVQGYYSPRNPVRIPGWSIGLPCRIVFVYNTVDYIKHLGLIMVITPQPGAHGQQRVEVISYDGIHRLLEADASRVQLQEHKTESELIAHVLSILPTAVQPAAIDLDVGLNDCPVAFDKSDGAKALALIRDAALSAFGLVFIKGDGTFRYLNRQNRTNATSLVTINDTMHGMEAPTTVDSVYNKFQATVHPRTISASPTELLYTLPAGNATFVVPPSETLDVWTSYTDPNNRNLTIGGADIVTTLIPGTHYQANTLKDGTGVDVTANLTVTIEPFAATALYHLTNNGVTDAYMTVLKVIGKAIRDIGEQTVESITAQPYGELVLAVNLPLQSDILIARDLVTYLQAVYSTVTDHITSVSFIANSDATLMTAALAVEPGDLVTIGESVTGMNSVKVTVTSVELDVNSNGMITCKWGLTPTSPWTAWLLEVAGRSELDDTTILGF